MKKQLFWLWLFFLNALSGQTLTISEDFFIGSADGYGIVGKFNDRLLFYTLDGGKVKFKALDPKLRKLWEKEIEPDRKNHAKTLEVISGKQGQDLNLIYQYSKKNHNYIKVHKYDGQLKLLDSTTVHDWGKDFLAPNLIARYSEDRKIILVYEINDNKIKALAVRLDTLRKLWFSTFDFKGVDAYEEGVREAHINNKGEAFFIVEDDNRTGSMETHQFRIKKISGDNVIQDINIPLNDHITVHAKFSYDNVNNKLVAAGLFSGRNHLKALGYYFLTIPPAGGKYEITKTIFDNSFITSQNKKVADNKGIDDLWVQEIVHKRDGGILAVFEEVKEVARNSTTWTRTFNWNRELRPATDYYYDNVYAVSINADGSTVWKSTFFKKQISQDDDARFSSYFLFKTPTALRFLFNDEIERSTTLSEYVLKGNGENERHTIANTAGQNMMLRFRDALQTGSNEVIVPSDDRRRVKLVKIEF